MIDRELSFLMNSSTPGMLTDSSSQQACSLCGTRSSGVVFIAGNRPYCTACTEELARALSRSAVKTSRTPEMLSESVSPEKSLPLLLLGHLQNMDLLLGVIRMFRTDDSKAAGRIINRIITLLGLSGAEPMNRLLRTSTYIELLRNRKEFTPYLLDYAAGLDEMDLSPQISLELLIFNLARLLAQIDTYNPRVQTLIRLALLTVQNNGNADGKKNLFRKKADYYLPQYDDSRTLKLSLPQLMAMAVSGSAGETAKENVKVKGSDVDPEALENITSYFETFYRAPELKSIYDRFCKVLLKEGSRLLSVWNPRSGSQPRKAEAARIVAFAFLDRETARDLFDHIAPPLQKILKEMIWEHALISLGDACTRLGVRLSRKKSGSYYGSTNDQIPDELSLMNTFYLYPGYRFTTGQDSCLALDPIIEFQLRMHLDPPGERAPVLKQTPAEGLRVSTGETGITRQLSLLDLYLSRSPLKRTKEEKIRRQAVKEAAKIGSIEEPYSQIKELEYLRSEVLLEVLDACRGASRSGMEHTESPEELIKSVFAALFDPAYPEWKQFTLLFHNLLDYLRTNDWITEYPDHMLFDNHEREVMITLLRQLEVGSWVTAESLYKARSVLWYGEFREKIPARFRRNEWSNFSLSTSVKTSYRYENVQLTLIPPLKRVGYFLPQLKAILFVLNSLGILDAAFGDPVNEVLTARGEKRLSRFDGLKEVSLTPLGAWLIGKADGSEAPKLEEQLQATAVLDPKRLLISVSADDPILSYALGQFARPLGRHSYQVTPELVLKGCRSVKDIKKKIRDFQNTVSSDLPPLWVRFFDDLVSRAFPVTGETEDYSAFSLDPERRDLIDLFFTDPVLSSYAVKGEDYRIFIRHDQYRKVKNRLAELGYLMPE
jgi:hypothetical protein